MILHRQMIFKQVTKEETQLKYQWDSICTCCLVTLCKTLCDPMDMPGFPVLHNLPSWLKLMSIELTMPSFHLILCHPLLLPSIFLSIRVLSSELTVNFRWPNYWSLSFSTSPSSEYSGLTSFKLTGLTSLRFKGLSRVFFSTIIWKHDFFGAQPSLWSISHICIWLLERL